VGARVDWKVYAGGLLPRGACPAFEVPASRASTYAGFLLDLNRPDRRRVTRRLSAAPILLAALAIFLCALCASPTPAIAQCSQSGTTENCGGTLPNPVEYTAPTIDTLNVGVPPASTVTSGTGDIKLTGSGAAPGNDVSPLFHPAMGRIRAWLEPWWLGDATGGGAEPPT
jgi:hypothetical protein